jgi:hypothetical protein
MFVPGAAAANDISALVAGQALQQLGVRRLSADSAIAQQASAMAWLGVGR